MAKNFKYSGKRITIVNLGTAVASGSLCRRNGFIGIPLVHGAAGQSIAFALEGVFGMTFSGQGTVTAGTLLYWDTSAGALSLGSASDDYAAVKAVTAPDGNGAFDGLLLPQNAPMGQDQS